jgi:hypothetical protein
MQSANRYGEATEYTVDDLLDDVRAGIWKELTTHKPIDVHRRNLQKTYVESLISLTNPSTPSVNLPGLVLFFGPNIKNTDLPSIAKAELSALRSRILTAIPLTADRLSKYHLLDIADRIRKALDPKE